jgi:peroxiredoxin
MFKRQIIAFLTLGFIVTSNTSCNKLSANDIKQDFNQWVNDLITPSKSTLEKVENGFVIKGNIKNSPKNLLVLWELTPAKLIFIDSIRTDEKGNFQLKGNTKEMIFCQLQMGPEASVYFAVDNNSKLNVDMSMVGSFVDYEIKGDELEDSKTLKSLLDMNTSFLKEVKGLEQRAQSIPNTPDGASQADQLRNEYQRLANQRNSFVREVAMKQKKGFIPYFVVSFGAIENPGFEMFQHAVNCAKAADPNSKYTQQIETQFNSEAKLMAGAVAPDFTLKTPAGEDLSLSSLRGKVVLIDFWASWCGPCRRENPNVRKLYRRFHYKGFEILGVSLDNDGNRWKGAIQADSLTWPHVSDLRGWQSSAAQLYQVSSIPQTYLIDKDGRIMAKGLRGPELEMVLEKLFADKPAKNEVESSNSAESTSPESIKKPQPTTAPKSKEKSASNEAKKQKKDSNKDNTDKNK